MSASILIGNVLDVLPTLPSESVNCVVTSPPYWNLRDYGTDGQLGLESTLEEYVANMVRVFAEVRRVLRDDGTLWLNLGDSYAGGGRGGNPDESPFRKQATNTGSVTGKAKDPGIVPPGLKPKDLVGIPWRVAFALQADGWYLRSDIIWSKPNPMPESVTDRPTKAHEYVFLLSKSARYHYDAEAIREPAQYIGPNGPGRKGSPSEQNFHRIAGKNKRAGGVPSGWDTGPGGHRNLSGRYEKEYNREFDRRSRNKRTVWTISTCPFPEAHFATYPEKLVEPCILAGCPAGGTVLDPFTGSGTTGAVACRLGRKFIGIELNETYVRMAERRIYEATKQAPLWYGEQPQEPAADPQEQGVLLDG